MKVKFLIMKNSGGKCNNMNKEEISWVVGEAIHFAYEMGCIDTLQNRGQANFDKQVNYILEHLNNDSERNTLKKLLGKEV